MIPTGESTLFSTLERTQHLRVGTNRERTHTSAHLPQNPPKNPENYENPKKKSQYDTCMQDTTRGLFSHRAYSDSWMDGCMLYGWTFQHSALSIHAFYPHGTSLFPSFFSSVHERNVTSSQQKYKTPKKLENHQNQKKSYSPCMHACKTRFAVHFYIHIQTDRRLDKVFQHPALSMHAFSPHALGFPSFSEHGTSCKSAFTRPSSPKTRNMKTTKKSRNPENYSRPPPKKKATAHARETRPLPSQSIFTCSESRTDRQTDCWTAESMDKFQHSALSMHAFYPECATIFQYGTSCMRESTFTSSLVRVHLS